MNLVRHQRDLPGRRCGHLDGLGRLRLRCIHLSQTACRLRFHGILGHMTQPQAHRHHGNSRQRGPHHPAVAGQPGDGSRQSLFPGSLGRPTAISFRDRCAQGCRHLRHGTRRLDPPLQLTFQLAQGLQFGRQFGIFQNADVEQTLIGAAGRLALGHEIDHLLRRRGIGRTIGQPVGRLSAQSQNRFPKLAHLVVQGGLRGKCLQHFAPVSLGQGALHEGHQFLFDVGRLTIHDSASP